MEADKTYMLQFGVDQQIIFDLYEEKDGVLSYRKTNYHYDIEKNEKSTLTMQVEIKPLTEQERKDVRRYNEFCERNPNWTALNNNS